MSGKYDDLLYLPHPVSTRHPRMSMEERAAQFAPFAALTGYEAVIQESARLTQERMEPNEEGKAELDQKLKLLLDSLPQHPELTVTYFVPDTRKAGGAYQTVTGNLQKIDLYHRMLVLGEDRRIPIEEILRLEGEVFQGLEPETR